MTFDESANPYPGARPFRPEESPRFFGRSTEAARLGRLWAEQPLTVLYGVTGCGKTSLLQAGALSGRAPLPVGRINGTFATPTTALPLDHNPWTLALLASWAPSERPGTLAGMSVTDFVARHRRRHEGAMLVAIDQFEDLFQGGPHRALHRDGFVRQLVEALDRHPGLRLLVVVRDSRRDDLGDHDELFRRAEWMGLGPLAGPRAFDAVTGPLEGTHRRLGRDAAMMIFDELGGEPIEPVMLQAVCAHLWERLPRTLQLIGREEAFLWADVPGALAAFVAAALGGVADAFGCDPEELRAWAKATLTDGVPVKQGVHDTDGMSNAIVQALEDRHLLRSEPGHRIRLLNESLRPALDRPAPAVRGHEISHLRAAKAALAAGDPDLAAAHAEEALRPSGRGYAAEACAILGDIMIERARFDQADGREPEAAEGFDRALEQYEAALQQYADLNDSTAAARMLTAIGQAALSKGDFAAAVRRLEEAVTLLPRDPAIRTQLARVLWSVGSHRRAMAEIDDVLRAEGDEPTALRARGEFNADQGRAEEALRDLMRAGSGAWPAARAARALALATLERLGPREADEEVGAVREQAPSNGPALYYAARVETLNGDPAAAAGLVRMAVKATEPRLSDQQRERAYALLGEGTDPLRP
ncbi:tetratricopeptide repeat protein [Actinocorallia longicatena]|uniref:Novel STAND NTPase 1 domain-containing protein n=1 Tax=Actinocorallia longicatena TaxID=111803 RepID=A0ABP6QKF8_9ACTN